MFVCFGVKFEGVVVKIVGVEVVIMLIDVGIGFKVLYFYQSWICVGEVIDDDEFVYCLGVFYDEVCLKLIKKVQVELVLCLENV